MKEAILYFTNTEKLKDSGLLRSQIPKITKDVPYIRYSANRKSFVYLIYDQMNLRKFEKQWDDMREVFDCFWLVYHNKPATEVILKLQNSSEPRFLGSVKGHHQEGLIANKVYMDLEKFVLSCYSIDEDGQKTIPQKEYNDLRDVVSGNQILNDKLRLLDKIYSGTALENIEIPAGFNQEVDRFFAKLNTDYYNSQNVSHTKNFIIFRDALLKQ